MNALVGTGALVRLILRRDRITLAIWIALLALVVIGTASSFATLYPTRESQQAFAGTVMGNPAIAAMLGPLFDVSIGGLTAWRLGGGIALLVGLFSVLTVIRHTRTEEERGRRELLGATVVGRHAPLSAALIVTLGANLALAALVAGGLLGLGLPAAGSIALGLSFAAAGLTFAALAGVTAQLTPSAGGAKGIGLALLGLAFLSRFLGDSGGENGPLSWLSWSSPIGWAQRTRSFAGESWWVFVLFFVAVVLLAVVAYALSSRRDIGAGLLPQRLGPPAASPRLSSPLALAWRLHSGALLAWTAGFAAVGLMFGTAATAMSDLLNTSPQLTELFAVLGGRAVLVDMLLSAVMSLAGLVASVYAVQATFRLRSEEDSLHAEPVLATSVGRLRWAASHLTFAAIGPAILLLALGAAAGLTYGSSIGQVSRELPRALAAALIQLPAVWVLAGIAVALFGLLPRSASLTWAALVAFLFVGELGQMLQLGQWLLDLSPFTHVPHVLAGEAPSVPLLGLLAVATLLTLAGLLGLSRRDFGRA